MIRGYVSSGPGQDLRREPTDRSGVSIAASPDLPWPLTAHPAAAVCRPVWRRFPARLLGIWTRAAQVIRDVRRTFVA